MKMRARAVVFSLLFSSFSHKKGEMGKWDLKLRRLVCTVTGKEKRGKGNW